MQAFYRCFLLPVRGPQVRKFSNPTSWNKEDNVLHLRISLPAGCVANSRQDFSKAMANTFEHRKKLFGPIISNSNLWRF